MPLYDYVCSACGNVNEKFATVADYLKEEKKPCPKCGKKQQKLTVLTAPSISLQRGEFLKRCPSYYRERKQQIAKAHRGHRMKI